jgi:transcriptional regulator with XRE-family HTH domain
MAISEQAAHNELFASRLRQLRKAKNLSQSELGNLAGLHYTNLSRYERGSSNPTADAVKRLAVALGVSSSYLLDGIEDGSTPNTALVDQDLLVRFRAVQSLSEQEKAVIIQVLDAFVVKSQLQNLVSHLPGAAHNG